MGMTGEADFIGAGSIGRVVFLSAGSAVASKNSKKQLD
jgi:hypothetical protein